MYVILIDKPGVYRMVGDQGLMVLETYRYQIGNQTQLIFSVAQAEAGTRVRIIGADDSVNSIPHKFLGQHTTIAAARIEIMSLHAPDACGAIVEQIARATDK